MFRFCIFVALMADALDTRNKDHTDRNSFVGHRICVMACTAGHDDMADSLFRADIVDQFDQSRITRCGIFGTGIYKFKLTVRNLFCECLNICIELICYSFVHMTHLKVRHSLSRNYIFLSG